MERDLRWCKSEPALGWVIALSVVVASASAGEQRSKPIAVKLLPGYSVKEQTAIDALAWEIIGPKGLTISFESGPNEGTWADPAKQELYSWYREQTINGRRVRLALTRPGLKTVWEPSSGEGKAPGNILLVTFQLVTSNWVHTANFAAKIASQEELADVLVMVLTFDPGNGVF